MLRKSSLLWVMVLFNIFPLIAQPVLTPQNVALGGGGSTYITDYNANFYNPANLFISDRIRNFDLGLAITGTYFNGVQNFTDLNEQRSNLEDYLYAFNPGSYAITEADRAEILEENYIRNRSSSLHQTRLEATLIGFKIRNSKRAISFAIRNRIASSFEVGRGWYSTDLQEKSGSNIVDRTLIHRYQSLYEVSLGFADSFQFFADMTPRLDEFSIGIAPKLVIGGAYQEAVWNNEFQQLNGSFQQVQDFKYRSSGNFTDATSAYLGGTNAQTALTQNITDELFDPEGFGVGMDLGFTYLITLGSDFSTIEEIDQRTQKSLRISFSITDIGFINYDNTSRLIIESDTTAAGALTTNDLSSDAFVGAPGQFLDFTDQFSVNNPFLNAVQSNESNTVLLPTAMHAGILLELNRIKLMGDLSIGLTNTAFNSTKLIASVGVEIRPLKFLPLRAGTQLATELPSYFSFGTAIETKIWDLSIATQFVSRTFSENPTLSGVTVAALQFHL